MSITSAAVRLMAQALALAGAIWCVVCALVSVSTLLIALAAVSVVLSLAMACAGIWFGAEAAWKGLFR